MTKSLLRAIVAFSTCTILWPAANAQNASPSGGEEPVIRLLPVANGEQHDITLREIVGTRRIRDPHISPDGTAVAFIIEQAFLERNESRSALYVVPTDGGGEPVKLLEERNISNVQWIPSGKSLTYLSSRSGSRQIWRIAASGGMPEQLFHHVTEVNQYKWSPNGQQIAFVAPDITKPEDDRTEDDAQGVVFNRSASNGVYGWIAKRSTARPPQPVKLWIYDVQLEKAEKLEQTIRSWRVDEPVGLAILW